MSVEFDKVAKTVMGNYLGVEEADDVLIVCDEKRLRIADALALAANKLKAIPAILVITKKLRKTNTVRDGILSGGIEHAIREMDVVILCLANVQAELEFRRRFIREVRRSPVRVANLPGINEDAFKKMGIAPSLTEIERVGNDIARLLSNGQKVRVTSPSGTDIEFELYGRRVPPEISTGYLLQPSTWGNLPGAEVYVAPKAWTANGTIAIDVTIDQDHRMTSPIMFEVKNGRVRANSIRSTDMKATKLLSRTLLKRNGDALCEFGVGLNRRIKSPTGITLIDEKIYSTAHFALGDNVEFGGEIDARIHYDMVFYRPSIWIDGKQIIRNGEFSYTGKDLLDSYLFFKGAIPNTALVRASPWSTCARMNGGLAKLWKGATGRMHAFMLGDKETSQAAERVWTVISHRGSTVFQIAKRTRIGLRTVKRVIEFMIFHQILETETLEREELEGLSKQERQDEEIRPLSTY